MMGSASDASRPAPLKPGYHDLPAGMLAALVTSLEMRAPARARSEAVNEAWSLSLWPRPPIEDYLDLYRAIGKDWLWFSRLEMDPAAVAAIIADDDVEVWRFDGGGGEAGLVELDFRETGACELAFFGVTAGLIGTGAGRWMMNRAIARAWSQPISRFWVHTCSLDHPGAPDFYERSGFRAFARQVEVFVDPRLRGLLPREAAPHVPLIAGAPAL
jgi:GNAT superfamily N-acetyltransferase